MIRYFISYTTQTSTGFGSGNCEITLARPIRSMGDVAEIQAMLRREGISTPIVMSFSRFDNDTASGVTHGRETP